VYDVRLEVNGVAYGGFRSGEFKLGLEQMCNSFNLRYSDVWIERGERPPIEEGDRCKLIVDGNAMIDGWVDEAIRAYDAMHYELSCSGRSTAGDLVDCSAVKQAGSNVTMGPWRNQRLSSIAADLVYPFAAVTLLVEGDEGAAIPKFVLQRGETVSAALCRLARLRSMLVYTAGTTLVMAKVGTHRTDTILRGGINIPDANILGGERQASLADRFSDYIFKGQTRARDDVNGVAANQIGHAVEDHGVPRYRPTLIVAGGADGPSDLGARAIMERNQRAGRGERITVKVEGWKTTEGYLWEPNILVRVTDSWLDVDQDLIVVSASFAFHGDTGQGGYQTSLELCDPKAFDNGDAPLIRRRRRRDRGVWAGDGTGASLIVDSSPLASTGATPSERAARGFGLSRGLAAPQPSAARSNRSRRRAPR
jgi:prophage tail gpP-like protein